MSKITNDGLIRSGTGCFYSCRPTNMATVGVKGLKAHRRHRQSKALINDHYVHIMT